MSDESIIPREETRHQGELVGGPADGAVISCKDHRTVYYYVPVIEPVTPAPKVVRPVAETQMRQAVYRVEGRLTRDGRMVYTYQGLR